MSATLKVGDFAKVTQGPHEGVEGLLFWRGQSRRDEQGSRFGLRDREGTVYWIEGASLEKTTFPLEPAAFRFGDRVLGIEGDVRGKHGEVFWMGTSKYRPGLRRYGVKSEGGDAWFADSDELRAA